MLAAIACLMCNPRRNPRLPLDSPPHATTSLHICTVSLYSADFAILGPPILQDKLFENLFSAKLNLQIKFGINVPAHYGEWQLQ